MEPDPTGVERRFDEDEVRRIFAQAAKLEGTNLPAHTSSQGLSLEQLVEIASDVGIPSRAVSAAAALVAAEGDGGTASRGVLQRVHVHPGDMSESAVQDLIRCLRGLPGSGAVTSVPDSVQWKLVTHDQSSTTIDVTTGNGETSIVLRAQRTPDLIALVCVGGSLGVVGGLIFAAATSAARGPELMSIVAVGTILGTIASVGYWRYLRRQWAERMSEYFVRVTRAVAGFSAPDSEVR